MTSPGGRGRSRRSSSWSVSRRSASEEDLRSAFNLGIGMVLVVPEEHDEEAVARAGETGMPAFVIGAVRSTGGGCSVSDPLGTPCDESR